ncbi:hypothetical protein [Hydrogenovibrio marinus]|uniref:NACHT domain-containing protein n=1 Tax=Hydrogenovibrio marinus TaxID=28885 RepID=A0A067A2K0_HYDMR|nr:hypothetical protein [Hydrogenovibrio marinus]KDN96590.1 hypothetical protein EI16_10070 [Hydrogenovibrio marinus]BBN60200.1 hypothetical protein HVMH_1794 [Hydrogenovibrio marinus]
MPNQQNEQENSDLINFSRAGDIFHYRWAVKRSLKLLDFNTDLTHITIEGSLEPNLKGECVVDLAEYKVNNTGEKSVEYFQLKHSTVQVNKHFTLSLLKDSIIGLAARFEELSNNKNNYKNTTFTIITNRIIAPSFKRNVSQIAKGKWKEVHKSFSKTIKQYTGLNQSKLTSFCKCLILCDSEGNYDVQKYDIHRELANLSVSKNVEDRQKLLVAKIWEKIEPRQSNVIKKEDILEAFDITDINDFFPAPPLFDFISNYVPRRQESEIIKSIKLADNHTIITASGGTGKSALSSNLSTLFDDSSIVIAYDCFGRGSYRKSTGKRHRTQDALVQLVNTFAKDSLCDQIIPTRNEPDDYWVRAFLSRIDEVCQDLHNRDQDALLVIVFDAADNAEMAAEEFGETSFARLLLKENVPQNCRLVFTCRPERLHLLDPPSGVNKTSLSPFTNEETLLFLQQSYPCANLSDATEFCRLTAGNPRVQANAFSLQTKSLEKLLLSFGSTPLTVEDLIEKLLNESIAEVRDSFSKNYVEEIERVCTGLATLPPFVPLKVLASVSKVPEDLIRSFISDLGRPLWLTDDSVQFRDEPTEKWFQDTFAASSQQISQYVDVLKPLSLESSYVAENIPLLLLKSQRFDELVNLALSDNWLPQYSEYDAKQIQISRLQYAFKAALKNGRLYESCQLALKAGEEIAANARQLETLSQNLDLTVEFFESNRIQELAYRKAFSGSWNGSETVYSASLLSSLSSTKGEAQSRLRSGVHWLYRYFEKRRNAKEDEELFHEQLDDIELLEITTAKMNLLGWQNCTDFLLSWSPQTVIFRLTSSFTERLIDSGDFETIFQMASYGKDNASFILAINSELMKVGVTAPKQCLTECLKHITSQDNSIEKPSGEWYGKKNSLGAFLSFFEACLIHKLPHKKIGTALSFYYIAPRLWEIADKYQHYPIRENYLRYLSIKAVLVNDFNLALDSVIDQQWISTDGSSEENRELRNAKEFIGRLLPWYMVKSRILAGGNFGLSDAFINAKKLSDNNKPAIYYHDYDPCRHEATKAMFECILHCKHECKDAITLFCNEYKAGDLASNLQNDLYFLRASCRNDNLEILSDLAEEACRKALKEFDLEESPESYSESYIQLARAVLSVGKEDAAAYFDLALNKASKFGNEAIHRWEAITAVAKRAADSNDDQAALAHRYMRCAEMIGDVVSREKHWDRNDALSTCFKLSPASAFAIVNRWKERNVGWDHRSMVSLANNTIDSGLLLPAEAYSLSAFSWEYGKVDFCEKCIAKERSRNKQQTMFDHLIREFRVSGVEGDVWSKISKVSEKYGLPNAELNNVSQLVHIEKTVQSPKASAKEETDENSWDSTYGEFDILTPVGFQNAFLVYEQQEVYRQNERFWSGCYQKISSRKAAKFLSLVCEVESLDFYDIKSAFEYFPQEWKAKASVEAIWNQLVKKIVARFPYQFVNIYSYYSKYFTLDRESNSAIQEGIVKGLSCSVDIESSEALFGFVHFNADKLSVEDSNSLINQGLSRFEVYLEDDFGDGLWQENQSIPESLRGALVGYIFANLGSPFPNERWHAVHAVIRLFELDCQEAIYALIDHFEKPLPKFFTPNGCPFFDLHAKLYLLVALTRCVYGSSRLLVSRSEIFTKLAINQEQGILHQYYAKQICLQIAKDCPELFNSEAFSNISKSCISPFEPIQENRYAYKAQIPLRLNVSVSSLPDVWFAHDFDRYWFEPLGRVFGISTQQVEDLAKDILFNKWRMKFESQYIADNRRDKWKGLRDAYDTHASHHSYPQVDGYSFYLSYHLLLEVASKLLYAMPSLQNYQETSSEWDEWLSEVLILNHNNVLLSELRDPFPLNRREWTEHDFSNGWRWEIQANDFIDLLVHKNDSQLCLNVAGTWNEYKNGRNEDISYRSILVPKALSQSLLHTTIDYENHLHECYLLNFCTNDDKDDLATFTAKAWLTRNDWLNSVEEKDPNSAEMDARPYRLKDIVLNEFALRQSDDQKSYYDLSDSRVCFTNRFWSEDQAHSEDAGNSYRCKGAVALASVTFLLEICNLLNVDIALQVDIERSIVGHRRDRSSGNEIGYIPSYSKTFILSGDGKLRDTRKSYQLR